MGAGGGHYVIHGGDCTKNRSPRKMHADVGNKSHHFKHAGGELLSIQRSPPRRGKTISKQFLPLDGRNFVSKQNGGDF